ERIEACAIVVEYRNRRVLENRLHPIWSEAGIGLEHQRDNAARDTSGHARAGETHVVAGITAKLLSEPERAAGGGDGKQVVTGREEVGLRETVVPRRPA